MHELPLAEPLLACTHPTYRRLYPLTQNRTLPAVPFASNYRLIDMVLSNLINSNVRRVRVHMHDHEVGVGDEHAWYGMLAGFM